MKLLLATKNWGKIREIKLILSSFSQVDFYTLHDFPDYTPPEETGETFEDNAKIKAVHAAKQLGLPTLADDSGLVVPMLQGEPGVYSARYAGTSASDYDNVQKLLQKASILKDHQRNCYFQCTLVYATPSGQTKIYNGICEGELLHAPRGNNGFGYDPVFKKYDYSKSFAELDEETKNLVSHRRKALEQFIPLLEKEVCTIS